MSGIDVPAPSEREAWVKNLLGCLGSILHIAESEPGTANDKLYIAQIARAALSVPCRLDTDQASGLSDPDAPAPSSS